MSSQSPSHNSDENRRVRKSHDNTLLLAALLEQSPEPLLLFDASGMVMAANSAMMNLRPGNADLVGHHLERLFSFDGQLNLDTLMSTLHASAPVAMDCTPNGAPEAPSRWLVEFDVFHAPEAQSVFLGKIRPRPLQTTVRKQRNDVAFTFVTVAKYEVMGTVHAAAADQEPRQCHHVFFDQASPCPGCPLEKQHLDVGQVISSAIWDDAVEAFRLITARAESKHITVHERWISEQETAVLVAARIDRLAVRARATRRERVVLELLILGRSLEEIATAVGITVHTVKFHQANLLKKMGADSRVDLLRLLL